MSAALRSSYLCRETLTWLAPDSREAAATEGTLGTLAQLRGDYDSAERSHRQVLEIFTRLGDQKNMAASYHQLGMLAEQRGDYDAAEPLYRRALDTFERIGDQADAAASYHQLGILAQLRGDYDTAEPLYRRAPAHRRADRRPGRHGPQLRRPGRLERSAGNLDQAVTYRAALWPSAPDRHRHDRGRPAAYRAAPPARP